MESLNANTTRREFLATIARAYADSAKHGGNTAILKHVEKLHFMSDAEWPAHRAKLLASREHPARRATISAMAQQLVMREQSR